MSGNVTCSRECLAGVIVGRHTLRQMRRDGLAEDMADLASEMIDACQHTLRQGYGGAMGDFIRGEWDFWRGQLNVAVGVAQ